MTEADFPLDGGFPLDPSPDEEAWSAWLDHALPQIDGNPENGLTNAQLAAFEQVVGAQLPFELGLLLVMGVPDGDRWWRWDENPAAEWHRWLDQLHGGVLFDVEHNGLWLHSWGAPPASVEERLSTVQSMLDAAPPLVPVRGHRCMPVVPVVPGDEPRSIPVYSIVQTDIVIYGDDLAGWFHKQFDLALPLWEHAGEADVPFWSPLIEHNNGPASPPPDQA